MKHEVESELIGFRAQVVLVHVLVEMRAASVVAEPSGRVGGIFFVGARSDYDAESVRLPAKKEGELARSKLNSLAQDVHSSEL